MKVTGIELTEQEQRENLTTAYECDSINYWVGRFFNVKRDADKWVTSFGIVEMDNEETARYEPEGYQPKRVIVDGALLQKGANMLLDSSFNVSDRVREAIAKNDWDSEVCDCVIQAAVFGQLKYG